MHHILDKHNQPLPPKERKKEKKLILHFIDNIESWLGTGTPLAETSVA